MNGRNPLIIPSRMPARIILLDGGNVALACGHVPNHEAARFLHFLLLAFVLRFQETGRVSKNVHGCFTPDLDPMLAGGAKQPEPGGSFRPLRVWRCGGHIR